MQGPKFFSEVRLTLINPKGADPPKTRAEVPLRGCNVGIWAKTAPVFFVGIAGCEVPWSLGYFQLFELEVSATPPARPHQRCPDCYEKKRWTCIDFISLRALRNHLGSSAFFVTIFQHTSLATSISLRPFGRLSHQRQSHGRPPLKNAREK